MSIEIIYLSNYLDAQTASRRGIKEYSYAANKKVLNFALSLKPRKNVAILSAGRNGNAESHSFHRPEVLRSSGIPVYYAAFYYFPWVGYLLSAFSLACWVLRLYRRHPNAVYIIYNRRPVYLLALFTILMLRSKCYLDLEDGGSEFRKPGLIQKILDQILVKAFDHACSSGALIASEYLRRETRIKKVMPYYGTLRKINTAFRDWQEGKLRVMFGGTLVQGAGTAAIMEAVFRLHTDYPLIASQYVFFITGFGAQAESLQAFSKQFDRAYVEFKGNMSAADFHDMMQGVHIGLNIRDSAFLLAHVSFPSKVLDITSYGQLLISTSASDVMKIFNSENILLLDDMDLAGSLVEKLIWVAQNRHVAAEMAARNQTDMALRFSRSKTAQEVIEFIQ